MLYGRHMGRDSTAAWRGDHPWAKVYDAITDRTGVGRLLWRIGVGSDLEVLHRTARAELDALPDGAAVLDLPCGGGVVLRDLPEDRSLRYTAADVSPAMLQRTREEAAERGIVVETVEADVEDLPFDDGAFDLVLTFTSLHCFPDPHRAVQELVRAVRPGGRLAGSTMLRGGPPRHRLGWVGGTALGVLGPGCTRAELEQWLAEAGLVDVVLDPSGAITYFAGTRSA